MKIEQEKEFKPITITLESLDEATIFFDFVEANYSNYDSDERLFLIALSNKLGVIIEGLRD